MDSDTDDDHHHHQLLHQHQHHQLLHQAQQQLDQQQQHYHHPPPYHHHLNPNEPTVVTPTSSYPIITQQYQLQQSQSQNQNFTSPPLHFIPVSNSSASPGPRPTLEYSEGSGSPPLSGQQRGRRPRGRPRRYPLDQNNLSLGLSPTIGDGGTVGLSPTIGDGGTAALSNYSGDPIPSGKRARGRPSSSAKRQMDALGSSGNKFTPHVIIVNPGEDVGSKLTAFAQQGPRTVCILSATGVISRVTLRQSAMSGGLVSYEGQFQIICLSGSFVPNPSDSENSGKRTGGLTISLSGADGHLMGGSVSGMLVAASSVTVIVGSFNHAPPTLRFPNNSGVAGFGPGPGPAENENGVMNHESEDGQVDE